MKKLILIITGILIAIIGFFWLGPKLMRDISNHTRQFYKEKTANKKPLSLKNICQINGHDCWKVVQLLAKTKITPTEEAYTYENPALAKLGLAVTKYDMFKDGGSTFFILNDEVFIYTNRKIGSPREQIGAVTIRFKKDPKSTNPEFDGPQFAYSPNGKRIK